MEKKKVDLKIEELEERIAPGLLLTLPAPAAALQNGSEIVAAACAAGAVTGGGGAAAITAC